MKSKIHCRCQHLTAEGFTKGNERNIRVRIVVKSDKNHTYLKILKPLGKR